MDEIFHSDRYCLAHAQCPVLAVPPPELARELGHGRLARTTRFPDAVVDHVRQQLITLLGLQECRFEYGSLLGHPPRLEPDGTVLAGHSHWDVQKAALPAQEIELRTFGDGQYFGGFMMKPNPDSRPSLQARLVAVTLAEQAGRALAAGTPTLAAR